MDYDIIINRSSGSGFFSEQETLDQLETIFTDAGHKIRVQILEPTELDQAIAKAIDRPSDGIIIGGGDGSITSAADQLVGTDKALGILPLGTFNLEARDLHLPLDPLEAARELAHGHHQKIDLLRVNDDPCLCTLVIGFYPTLARLRRDVHGSAWWLKSARIGYEILAVATRSPVLDLTLRGASETIRRKTRATAFSPGEYLDSPGLIPQREDLASGQIFAYLSEHLSRRELLGLAGSYLRGSAFSIQGMNVLKFDDLELTVKKRKSIPAMIDGEIIRLSLPCKITLEQKALTVMVPDSMDS
jgi:diacylglycerol kinase family enzyme